MAGGYLGNRVYPPPIKKSTKITMKCKYIKNDGSPCKGFAVKDSDYCWAHTPDIDNKEKQYSRYRGGVNRHSSAKVKLPKIVLSNMQDIPAFLVTTIKRMDAGEIEIRLGTAIGYLSNVLMKSYELTDLEPRIEKVENYIKENFKGEITNDYTVVEEED